MKRIENKCRKRNVAQEAGRQAGKTYLTATEVAYRMMQQQVYTVDRRTMDLLTWLRTRQETTT